MCFQTRYSKVVQYNLVICDEFGYISYDKEDADIMFNHLSLRAVRKSIIININCFVGKLKQVYPDYKEFKEEYASHGTILFSKYIGDCFDLAIGTNYNNLRAIASRDPSFAKYTGWNEQQINQYFDCYFDKLHSKWAKPSEMLSAIYTDKDQVTSFIESTKSQCYDEIANKIIEENQKLEELQRLFWINDGYEGVLSFSNSAPFPIKLCVAYYYWGTIWEGWTTEGFYNLEPGEKHIFTMPKNVNRYIYYYAKSLNSGYVWKGEDSFIISKTGNFKIPNADKQNTLSYSSDFYYFSEFKKYDFGESSTFHSMNLTFSGN